MTETKPTPTIEGAPPSRPPSQLLTECAAVTRRACEDMIRLIDAGKFAGEETEVQFGWLYTLKNRRELIKSTIMNLDGCREDRTGQSTRAAADRAWKG